jgi:hypothetical protein
MSLEQKSLREAPAYEEPEAALPPFSIWPHAKVCIPPKMMPSDEIALQYFDIYFTHIHPYVPVLHQQAFFLQWNTTRASISPLILEGIFALAARLTGDSAQSHQWLTLIASKGLVGEVR